MPIVSAFKKDTGGERGVKMVCIYIKIHICGRTNSKANKGLETKAAQNELNRTIIEILGPHSLCTHRKIHNLIQIFANL